MGKSKVCPSAGDILCPSPSNSRASGRGEAGEAAKEGAQRVFSSTLSLKSHKSCQSQVNGHNRPFSCIDYRGRIPYSAGPRQTWGGGYLPPYQRSNFPNDRLSPPPPHENLRLDYRYSSQQWQRGSQSGSAWACPKTRPEQ